jgi:hypothetical protein
MTTVRTRGIFAAAVRRPDRLGPVVSLFCRHNRFTADCPICSRGTVLDERTAGRGARSERATNSTSGAPRRAGAARPASQRRSAGRGAVTVRGPSASVGPYQRGGETYEVRLERVPGGLRLAEWAAGQLRAVAPVLAPGDLADLIRDAATARVAEDDEHAELVRALAQATQAPPASVGAEARSARSEPAAPDGVTGGFGASPGRSGELRDELRVERLDEDRVRVARWVLRPGTGWDRLDAPTMLPARRYAEALADAARQGLLAA